MKVELTIKRQDGTMDIETHDNINSALASYSYNELSCAYTERAVIGMDLVVRYDDTQKAVADAISEMRLDR